MEGERGRHYATVVRDAPVVSAGPRAAARTGSRPQAVPLRWPLMKTAMLPVLPST
eukprot:COSAG05_NODE_2853_length_2570_cov_2.961149_1_plen_55_part_00